MPEIWTCFKQELPSLTIYMSETCTVIYVMFQAGSVTGKENEALGERRGNRFQNGAYKAAAREQRELIQPLTMTLLPTYL